MKRTSANSPLSLRERARVRAVGREVDSCRVHNVPMPSPPAPLPMGEGGNPNRRRGAILVVILVCFVVAAGMFVILGRQSVAQRREAETQIWTAQAQWIAEAAFERAAARLTADAKYAGETWTISAAELGGKDGAQARIRVEKVGGWPSLRIVRVEADYPDDQVHRSRWSKKVAVDIKTPIAEKDAKKP
jgi:hypothetical protein